MPQRPVSLRSTLMLTAIAIASTAVLFAIWLQDSEFDNLDSSSQLILTAIATIVAAASSTSNVLLTLRLIRWLKPPRWIPPEDFPPPHEDGPSTPRWPPFDGKHCGVPIPPRLPSPLHAHASIAISAD